MHLKFFYLLLPSQFIRFIPSRFIRTMTKIRYPNFDNILESIPKKIKISIELSNNLSYIPTMIRNRYPDFDKQFLEIFPKIIDFDWEKKNILLLHLIFFHHHTYELCPKIDTYPNFDNILESILISQKVKDFDWKFENSRVSLSIIFHPLSNHSPLHY